MYYIGGAAAVLVLVLLVFWYGKEKRQNALPLSAPQKAFTKPVYLTNESPTVLNRPLTFEVTGKKGLTNLTPAQKTNVEDFKKKILDRVASGVPLTKEEKSVLSVSISTSSKEPLGGILIVDQSVYRFTASEIKLITDAIRK